MRAKILQMLYWIHERTLGIIFPLWAFVQVYYKLIKSLEFLDIISTSNILNILLLKVFTLFIVEINVPSRFLPWFQ